MLDFFEIKEDYMPRKKRIEVYASFKVCKTKDLMIRGKSFYAIWDEEVGMWSTDEYDVARLVDKELYSLISDKKHLVVYNKSDLFEVKEENKIYISAKNNDIKNLVVKIKEIFNIGELIIKPSFNNIRQLGILRSMVTYLEEAIKDAKNNQPIDLVSVNVMAAYNSSLDLLGQNNKNDLTDEIFSRFCVGK